MLLTRARSFDNLLSTSPVREQLTERRHSPPIERRNFGPSEPPARGPLLPPHLKGQGKSVSVDEDTDSIDGGMTGSTKPRPAKIRAGVRKGIPNGPGFRIEAGEQRFDSNRSVRDSSPHQPLAHTVSEPPHKRDDREAISEVESMLPKTYVAVSDYTSQTPGCLSFSEGDKCFLVRKTKDGWWMVNIGGREGWTPGDFWEEERKVCVCVCACTCVQERERE